MSKTLVGKILKMFVSTGEGRREKVEVTLEEKGVLGDKYYDKDIERSILITSVKSYELALKNAIEVPHGSLGENFLVDFNPYKLIPGKRLVVGGAVLEISQNCTICKSLTKIDSKLPKLLKEDRGIFAKVISSGIIKKSDNIYLLNEG